MNSILENLKEYFENTPKKVLEKDWNEMKYLNDLGPMFVDFQCICSVDYDIRDQLRCIKQIKHPFAEQMMLHFVSYVGRVPSDRADDAQVSGYVNLFLGD